VGAVVGVIGAAAFWIAARLGLTPPVAAIVAVAASVLTTGGLHEDGLADTADGFGGGHSAPHKLEIMRDSRIGSYGAMALMLALGLRIAALASLGVLAGSERAAAALIAAGILGRGAVVTVLLCLPPARSGGMSAALGPVPAGPGVAGIALACLAALLPGGGGALVAAAAVTGLMILLAARQVGGHTGDVLGATEQAAECAALVGMLIR
jgi:adenosylcobinamide-GDP ribazoletransferase